MAVRIVVRHLPRGLRLAVIAYLFLVSGLTLLREMARTVPSQGIDGVVWRVLDELDGPAMGWIQRKIVAPHMPRLDWQMWFAALNPRGAAPPHGSSR